MQNNASGETFDFNIFDCEIDQTLAFRRVSMEKDLHRLHEWMNTAHVIPFWQLNGPLGEFQKHLQKALADSHQSLYIGYLNGVPMSYWEAYWVKDDVIGKFYDYDSSDRGVHLLIGPGEYVGKGYAVPLLRAMVAFQFQVRETDLVVAEPDIRNEKMIHIFKKCGFQAEKPVDLPDKRGLLMFCRRREFERRWPHVTAKTTR